MPNVGIRFTDDELDRLKRVARANGRTASGEVKFRLRPILDEEISVRRAVRAGRAGRVERAIAPPGGRRRNA